jgi:hypothetical protein
LGLCDEGVYLANVLVPSKRRKKSKGKKKKKIARDNKKIVSKKREHRENKAEDRIVSEKERSNLVP